MALAVTVHKVYGEIVLLLPTKVHFNCSLCNVSFIEQVKQYCKPEKCIWGEPEQAPHYVENGMYKHQVYGICEQTNVIT